MKYLKHILTVFKILVLVLSVGFIIYKIYHIPRLSKISVEILTGYLENWIWFVLLIILFPFNIGIESLKWQLLVSKLENLSFRQALKSVFAGISSSIFMPGRTGEFAGRVFTLTKGNRAKGVALSFAGNLSQLLLTLSFGILGVLLYHAQIEIPFFENLLSYLLLLSIAVVIVFFIYISPWIIDYILRLFPKTELFLRPYLSTYFNLKKGLLFSILFLSFVRYCIFSLQFFSALKFCSVDIPWTTGIQAIATVYLALTILPLATFNELAVRCSFSAIVIGMISNNILGIIIASSLLWIINLAIPALIGNYFIIKTKAEPIDFIGFFKNMHKKNRIQYYPNTEHLSNLNETLK